MADKSSTAEAKRRKALRLGVLALAVIVGLVAWLTTRGGDGDSSGLGPTTGIEAQIVSPEGLEDLVASAGHPVYWAGEIPGKKLEASETTAGNFQLRYLDQGTEAGRGGSGVLTIGSYPLEDATAAVEGFAQRQGSIVRLSPDGREVVSSVEKPTSVYFASPDGSVQVEVYDPNLKRAMSLAVSDRVRPVG